MPAMARQGRNTSRDGGEERKGGAPGAGVGAGATTQSGTAPPGSKAAAPATVQPIKERSAKGEETPLPPLSDSEAKALGLVYTKVARVSERDTAEKLVRPKTR